MPISSYSWLASYGSSWRNHLLTLLHALVVSRLDCCSVLYVVVPLEKVWKLQLAQNVEGRRMPNMAARIHITSVWKHLLWLLVCFWAQFKVFALVLHSKYSLLLFMPAQVLRLAEVVLLVLPPHRFSSFKQGLLCDDPKTVELPLCIFCLR